MKASNHTALRLLRIANKGAHTRRDVKPSNILLTEDGRAKVSDMGLSRADFFSSSTAFAGTFKYAAPEVLLGRPSNDKVHGRLRLCYEKQRTAYMAGSQA